MQNTLDDPPKELSDRRIQIKIYDSLGFTGIAPRLQCKRQVSNSGYQREWPVLDDFGLHLGWFVGCPNCVRTVVELD